MLKPGSRNLSGDNATHADRLAGLGIAPVVTVLARDYARRAVRRRFKNRRMAHGAKSKPRPLLAMSGWRELGFPGT
jgi:hypothetical protein